ncbi:Protein tpx2 [Coemansia sp. RSA 2050]|nr:Protein tpx2 [Coemansia sp. RSA 2050]
MTKARTSSRGSRLSVSQTPKRSSTRKPVDEFDDNGNDSDLRDVWDFEAPMYYDFANAQTPGRKADKWFDYAHPTPAISRKTKSVRLSGLTFLSPDRRESLLPNRPSLSPSRIVVEADGRLTIDGDTGSKRVSRSSKSVRDQDIELDTDEEIEFNNWKSANLLTSSSEGTKIKGHEDSSVKKSVADSSEATESAGKEDARPIIPAKTALQLPVVKRRPVAAANNTGKVTKRATKVAATKSLTIPIEGGRFMQPTKVAARRLSMKKRDKANQQAIAEVIAKSINRRLSQDAAASLTVPKPFTFHEPKSMRGGTKTEAGGAPAPAPKQAAKLNKKAQDNLVAKLVPKRKSMGKADNVEEEQENRSVGGSEVSTPPRTALTKKPKLTMPMTPQFAKPKRARREAIETVAEALNAKPAAKPKTNFALPLLPHFSPPKSTVPQPFTFRSDAIAERHLLKLREDIARLKAEEEALRQFRANPLPAFPTPKKPKWQPVELHVSPFHLQIDTRGDAYQRQLHERLAELEQRKRDRMEFKARPIPPSIDQPFVPQPSAIPLTAIEEILLRTELRSEERRAYDEDRMERERIREDVLARKRLEEERREEEEIKRLRKILVHKAQPVRHYKQLVIKPSDRPLTVPKTPQWNIRTRKRSVTPTALTH